jgi:hypothetical protein
MVRNAPARQAKTASAAAKTNASAISAERNLNATTSGGERSEIVTLAEHN